MLMSSGSSNVLESQKIETSFELQKLQMYALVLCGQLDGSCGFSAENPAFHDIHQSFHRASQDSLYDDLRPLVVSCSIQVI